MDERLLKPFQPGEEIGLDRLHYAIAGSRRRHYRSRPTGLTLEETVAVGEEVFGSLDFTRLDHESERPTIISVTTVVENAN